MFIPRRQKRNRKRRFRRKREYTSGEDFYNELADSFHTEQDFMDAGLINHVISRALKKIPQLRRNEAKKMGELAVSDMIRDTHIPIRILQVILDLTQQKLNGRKTADGDRKKKSFDKIALVVGYQNHGVGMIDLGGIINTKDVQEHIPPAVRDKKEPMLVYRYDQPIRNTLFNYQRTCDEYQEGQEEEMHCDCDSSIYKDKDHNHVVTGDLSIIENQRLRDLFYKGPNYREPKPINWNKNNACIKKDLDLFINKWSNNTGVSTLCFKEWRNEVMKKVQEKIARLRIKTKYKPTFPVLRDRECLKELDRLQDKFVLVPIDKAANNIGFICKKYYLEIIKKEVSSDTYVTLPQEDTERSVMRDIIEDCNHVGISVHKDFKNLPSIHATIKMHKDPVKFRYIIGSRTSVLKPLAKKLVTILQLVMKSMRNYCDKIRFYTGFNRYWIVENNEVVLRNMDEINSRNNGRNIECFDFSTLYTKIDPDDLKDKLLQVVKKAFRGGQNKYLRISNNRITWTNKAEDNVYTIERIEMMIDTLVDSAYFKFGNTIYRQKIGIPMGIDPAPQMANLYLFSYEFDFMERLAKEDYRSARKFNYTCRFIDDLETLNNDGKLSDLKEDIYPPELVCNKENVGDQRATFLDMETSVIDRRFVTKTYDKRESYDFEIVNYPDLSGNIPRGSAYGVYTSQLIRYARVCSYKEDFIARAALLKRKLKEKGFTEERLRKTSRKCIHNNNWIIKKYQGSGFRAVDLHYC